MKLSFFFWYEKVKVVRLQQKVIHHLFFFNARWNQLKLISDKINQNYVYISVLSTKF